MTGGGPEVEGETGWKGWEEKLGIREIAVHDERIKVNVIPKNWGIVNPTLVFFTLIEKIEKKVERREGKKKTICSLIKLWIYLFIICVQI